MRKIKIDYTGFWTGFDKRDNYFSRLLSRSYDLELSDKPDYLIYANFNYEFPKYKCTRIFFTGENIRPNFDDCDYAFTFDFNEDPRHYRLPLYALYLDMNPESLVKKDFDVEKIAAQKTKFCSFVVSSPRGKERYDFFNKLSKYKKVDSGGRALNNIGGPVPDKLAFIRDYKFTIAFENSSYPGYTTEKVLDSMRVNNIGIYWGNPLVDRDFNTRSFLNYLEFKSEEELIERIIELDNDRYKYMECLSEYYYHNNQVNEFINPDNVLKQFDIIFNSDKRPIAQDPVKQTILLGKKITRRLVRWRDRLVQGEQ